jgi:diguanylate cyclase (GGDEF)-like protein
MKYGTEPRIELRPGLAATLAVVGFLLVGMADYSSGVEVRAYPLYFLPLSVAAWHFGRIGACVAAVTATAIWILSNWAAGLQYSSGHVWIINSLSQALAFGTIAALLSWARTLLDREQALSRSDSLTGLENARAFRASLELAVASCRRKQRPLTLAYIDLDNFKSVNDRYGHSRGDALLRDVASVLQNGIRATDSAARIGGDEFVVCLPESHEPQAQSVLERLREALAEITQTDECTISASIGAFCWEVPPEDVDTMISSADQLMYKVKKSGKNRLEIISMMTNQANDSLPHQPRQAQDS